MSPANERYRVKFTPGLARILVEFLRMPEPVERGGVLLGRRGGAKIHVALAVFPPQLAHASGHCAFDVASIEYLRNATSTFDRDEMRPVEKIVGWVHTHPKHGLFLSGTDVTTFANWTQLDPAAVAVVIDPYLPGSNIDRIGWWAAPDVDEAAVDGPRMTGRRSVAEASPAEPDTLSWEGSARLAAAVTQEGNAGRWELVSASGVHCVFPTPQLVTEGSA
jgi:proteasome lid subunit RPN8/RPN11